MLYSVSVLRAADGAYTGPWRSRQPSGPARSPVASRGCRLPGTWLDSPAQVPLPRSCHVGCAAGPRRPQQLAAPGGGVARDTPGGGLTGARQKLSTGNTRVSTPISSCWPPASLWTARTVRRRPRRLHRSGLLAGPTAALADHCVYVELCAPLARFSPAAAGKRDATLGTLVQAVALVG